MVKHHSKKLVFFWIYYIFILIGVIYTVLQSIYLINLPLGAIFIGITLILSIFAIYNFNKNNLSKITKILPWSQIAFYCLILIIGFISAFFTEINHPINLEVLGFSLIIISVGFSIFKIIISIYVIKNRVSAK